MDRALVTRWTQRLGIGVLCLALVLLWLVDAELVKQREGVVGFYPLVSGAIAAILLVLPRWWLGLRWRAAVAAAGSGVLTAALVAAGRESVAWGATERAGIEALESMRRLVRVLRMGEWAPPHSGELEAELAELVANFTRGKDSSATLEFSAAARQAHLPREVETSAHRVVQEALTNVHRHAPGTDVVVTVDAEDGWLRVRVDNPLSPVRVSAQPGGRGGFGLAGLQERIEAVDGSLWAGRTVDGGWRVIATLPLLSTTEGDAGEQLSDASADSRRPGDGAHRVPTHPRCATRHRRTWRSVQRARVRGDGAPDAA